MAHWQPGPLANIDFPALRPAQPTSITLIDKPAAAQSIISVGQIAGQRQTPDYFALVVMNTIFGGQFSSRLNLNLREDKGYTYGARSSFDWRQQPGMFVASASVETNVTAAALAEVLKEFRGLTGDRPISEQELEFAKASIVRGFPAGFETARDIAGRLHDVVEFALPDDYLDRLVPNISAVTAAEVMQVAKRHIDPEHLSIVVVGDRSQIEAQLRGGIPSCQIDVRQFDQELKLKPVD
jgi:predicted Zn-dependent peptidase